MGRRPASSVGAYQLWQAPYATGTGTGSWQQVDLGSDPPGDTAPSLVVKGATAYLVAADAKNVTHLYVASAGTATKTLTTPCSPAVYDLSAGVGSLWVACTFSSGGSPAVGVSTDGGVTWKAVVTPSAYAIGAIGGVDATTAIISEGTGLTQVSTAGQPRTASIAKTANGFSFIGFTDGKVGFALSQPDPARLWRTTDGGLTWSAVVF